LQNLGRQVFDPDRGLEPRLIQFSLRMEY
jgi:hypothetical protein